MLFRSIRMSASYLKNRAGFTRFMISGAILSLALLAPTTPGLLAMRGAERDESDVVASFKAESLAAGSDFVDWSTRPADDSRVATPDFPYRVQLGDTLASVAQKLRLDVGRLAQRNSVAVESPLHAGDVLLVDLDVALTTMVVQPGEDYATLAHYTKVAVEFLVAINNDSLEDGLVAGQSLIVPQRRWLQSSGTQRNVPQTTGEAPIQTDADPAKARTQAMENAAAQDSRERQSKTAPTSRSGRDALSKQEEFIAIAGAAARDAQAITGVPASVTVAQAILESNWGKAAIGNNYFGIKADTKPGPAGVTWSPTKEYTKKGWITIKAAFRAYDNVAQSFTDHSQFFVENSRYAEAMRQADDPKAFAKLIHEAGYATDPKYAQSLIRLMDIHNLYQFDDPTPNG